MTQAARRIKELRKKLIASDTLDSIDILDMIQCTDNPAKLDYHVRLDIARRTGALMRVVEEFGEKINVYVV